MYKVELNENIQNGEENRIENLHRMAYWAQAYIKHFSLPIPCEQRIDKTFELLFTEITRMQSTTCTTKVRYESHEIERNMDSALTKPMRNITEVVWGIFRISNGDLTGGGVLIGDGLLKIVESVGEFKEVNYAQKEARKRRRG